MAGEPTFTPPVNPEFPLDESREPRVRVVPYGDGYTGRQQDGINSDPSKQKLSWSNLTQSEMQSIWNFIVARKGVEAFLYAVPWYTSGNTTLKWIAPKYRRRRSNVGVYDVEIDIEQVFEA